MGAFTTPPTHNETTHSFNQILTKQNTTLPIKQNHLYWRSFVHLTLAERIVVANSRLIAGYDTMEKPCPDHKCQTWKLNSTIQPFNNWSFQLFKYSSIQLSKFLTIQLQLFNYSSYQLFKFPTIQLQIFNYSTIQVSNYSSIQVFNYSSFQLFNFNYSTIQVFNYSSFQLFSFLLAWKNPLTMSVLEGQLSYQPRKNIIKR